MQIHGIQLDMGNSVQQSDAPGLRPGFAARHIARVFQLRFIRSGRERWRRGIPQLLWLALRARRLPALHMGARYLRLCSTIRSRQNIDRHFSE